MPKDIYDVELVGTWIREDTDEFEFKNYSPRICEGLLEYGLEVVELTAEYLGEEPSEKNDWDYQEQYARGTVVLTARTYATSQRRALRNVRIRADNALEEADVCQVPDVEWH